MPYGYGYNHNTNYVKPVYRNTEAKTVRFSDSVDLEPRAQTGDTDRAIQSILADIEDVKNVLRKVCDLCRTQQEWMRTFPRDNKDSRQDPLVQKRPSLDEELGICLDKTAS